ncbi:MAG TPA: hypothetical protein VFG54_01840 [Prolixibacteraceae bacterium]|nr:hypothetical protein [Prolixibacteraceae bacterium]
MVIFDIPSNAHDKALTFCTIAQSGQFEGNGFGNSNWPSDAGDLEGTLSFQHLFLTKGWGHLSGSRSGQHIDQLLYW